MNRAFGRFLSEIGNKNHSQESIKNLYKGLVLHYLGLQNPTDEMIEKYSMLLEVATQGAIARGWDL